MSDEHTFVFGYGSLAARLTSQSVRTCDPGGYVADLAGFRRTWNVAMDNRLTVPGYKYYVDPATGERPEVFVAYVNLREQPAGRVNGYCLPVTEERLRALDARERSYERVDVSARVEPNDGFSVFAYIGRADARARFSRGADLGTVVVAASYHRLLGEGFARLGPEEPARFEASTDPPACPLRELTRVDVPG